MQFNNQKLNHSLHQSPRHPKKQLLRLKLHQHQLQHHTAEADSFATAGLSVVGPLSLAQWNRTSRHARVCVRACVRVPDVITPYRGGAGGAGGVGAAVAGGGLPGRMAQHPANRHPPMGKGPARTLRPQVTRHTHTHTHTTRHATHAGFQLRATALKVFDCVRGVLAGRT